MDPAVPLIMSTGLFTGMATSITLVMMPALRQSKNPLPIWYKVYDGGKMFGITTVLVSMSSALAKYYLHGDKMALVAAGLHMGIMPATAMMMPNMDKLYAMECSKDAIPTAEALEEARQGIEKWGRHHYFRIFFGASAFVVAVTLVKRAVE
jgi:hypothetical protein